MAAAARRRARQPGPRPGPAGAGRGGAGRSGRAAGQAAREAGRVRRTGRAALDDRGVAGQPVRAAARHRPPGVGAAHPEGDGRAGGVAGGGRSAASARSAVLATRPPRPCRGSSRPRKNTSGSAISQCTPIRSISAITTVWSPAGYSACTVHSSQPSASGSSGAPFSPTDQDDAAEPVPARVANLRLTASWPADSTLIAMLPASRSTGQVVEAGGRAEQHQRRLQRQRGEGVHRHARPARPRCAR